MSESRQPSRPHLRSFVTDRPIATIMLFLATIVFGIFSYRLLPVTLMPELSYPTITVRTEYPGAAPEEVENDISRPIEEALGVVGGLQKISSISRAEISDVVLEFNWDTQISDATQDVLERLDLVFLPDEAKRPLILHYDPELDPVMELSLSGQGDAFEGEPGLRRLRRLAELQLKRVIEPVEGIAAVRVKGGLEEEIHVWLDEAQLRRTRLSIDTVIQRLAQENINVAGGTIQEGRTEYLVRTVNEFEDIDQISSTVIATIEGRDVRVSDLGQVRMSHKDRQILTRADGDESVKIEIYKEADANIVALAKRVKQLVGRADPEKPEEGIGLAGALLKQEGALLKVTADRSVFIESSIREVRMTALMGGILAFIVLGLFLLEIRPTILIALSIPVSLFVTFAPLNLFHVTLNIMSLGGLALGIGMLVDSSIVVLESIYRCRQEGDDLVTAAIRGTMEVRNAVVASTLTTVAVFLPMVFVEGVAGQAFGDLGIAVVCSLLASTAVAVWGIPMAASRDWVHRPATAGALLRFHFDSWRILRRDVGAARRWLKPGAALWGFFRFAVGAVVELVGFLLRLVVLVLTVLLGRLLWLFRWVFWPLQFFGRGVNRWIAAMQKGYPGVLRTMLANSRTVYLVLIALTLGSAWVLGTLGTELLPEVRQGEFTFELALPVGTPLEETDRILEPIESAILAEREHIAALLVTFGYDPTQSQSSDEGEHTARFKVLLDAAGRRGNHEDAMIERIRQRLLRVPDLDARVTRPVLFSSKTPIEVELHGDDLAQLKLWGDRITQRLSLLPELSDVNSTLQSGAPEIQVVYDRERLTRSDLNIRQVAQLVRDKVQGNEATRFNLLDRRIPIMVRLGEADRQSVDQVERIIVNPNGELPIELGSIANVTLGEGPSEVRRIDSRRVALIRANLGSGSLGEAVTSIEQAIRQDIELPVDMNFLVSGQNEEWERSRKSLYLALGLSIFLVYVIMAVQFESILHPFVIMFSMPLAFIGTVAALRLFSIPLSVIVFLGMILLAGIVVNNAIVLIDYVNQLRRRGLEREEALVEAGRVRLRPILMTTLTTVLGLLPMALGLGDGAEIRTPMAISVISGLTSSTILTLLVIPAIYSGLEDALAVFQRRRRVEETGPSELLTKGTPS